jgi:Arc/MetJ family transcription regulator
MRTNIDIDDKLMKQAMKASGTATKRATVEGALRTVVQLRRQKGIRKWRGRIPWEGDLGSMREGRSVEREQRRKESKNEKDGIRQSEFLKASAGR